MIMHAAKPLISLSHDPSPKIKELVQKNEL
jgi:hypothetical protein